MTVRSSRFIIKNTVMITPLPFFIHIGNYKKKRLGGNSKPFFVEWAEQENPNTAYLQVGVLPTNSSLTTV